MMQESKILNQFLEKKNVFNRVLGVGSSFPVLLFNISATHVVQNFHIVETKSIKKIAELLNIALSGHEIKSLGSDIAMLLSKLEDRIRLYLSYKAFMIFKLNSWEIMNENDFKKKFTFHNQPIELYLEEREKRKHDVLHNNAHIDDSERSYLFNGFDLIIASKVLSHIGDNELIYYTIDQLLNSLSKNGHIFFRFNTDDYKTFGFSQDELNYIFSKIDIVYGPIEYDNFGNTDFEIIGKKKLTNK